MRKLHILLLILVLTSCNKFLEEVSKDQIVPKSAKDYKEFIFGEIYNNVNDRQIASYLDIMTDDCGEHTKKSSLGSDTRPSGFGYYCWQKDPEITATGARVSDAAWSTYYHHILVCNMILNDINKMSGTDQEKAQVRAESYMNRAFAYWMLVNLYGEPYTEETAATAKGVPINDLVGAELRNFQRAPVSEIYAQISNDIEAAIKEFSSYSGETSLFRWNYDAALVFASRVYLYMMDWENSVRCASMAIGRKPNLWDLNDKNGNKELVDVKLFCNQNPEILFSYGYYYINWFASAAKGAFPVSTELRNTYEKSDLRYNLYTGAYIRYQGSTFLGGKRYLSFKSDETSTSSRHGYAIRTAEAYLNRAEALTKLGKLNEAAKDIDFLRTNRITRSSFKNIEYADAAELMTIVRGERRKELCFEKHRWFDLRRWDRPRIEHSYTPDFTNLSEKVTYVLEQNDPAYTLPLPYYIVESDSKTENIDRPVREHLQSN